jgi:hypothetical protein
MQTNWTDKYKPNKIDDIIGNKYIVKCIVKWLAEYEENKKKYLSNTKKKKKIQINLDEQNNEEEDLEYLEEIKFQNTNNKNKNDDSMHSSMILVGDYGVGKTTVITSILKDKDYNIKFINLNELVNIENIDKYILNILTDQHIFNHVLETNKKKNVLIIDDLQTMSTQFEKKFVINILKLNEKNWYKPIIFISDNKHNKLISILKQNSKNIYFNKPEKEHLETLLYTICEKEKLYLENSDVVDKIINFAQNDYRRLIFILHDLKINYENNISNVKIDEYCITSKKKHTNIDIYKGTSLLLTKYIDIDECIKLYNTEKLLISLMIHQNYIKCISENKTQYNSKTQIITTINNIAKSISKGDNIDYLTHNEQIWDIKDAHCFYTCIYPSYCMSSLKSNIQNATIKTKLDFPSDLNKTSIKNINRKNVVNSNINLSNFEINDFIFLNKLIKNLLDDGKIKECSELFKDYGINVNEIESILKIDKINSTKTVLPTNIKKKLKLLINNTDSDMT